MQSSDPSVLGSKYSRRVSAHRRYLCAKLLEADGSVDLRAIRQGSRTFGHASPGARHSALDRIAPHGGAPTSRFPQGEPYYPVRGRGQVWDSALRRPETGTHFQSRAAHAVASTTNRQQVPSRSLPWRGRWQAFRLTARSARSLQWGPCLVSSPFRKIDLLCYDSAPQHRVMEQRKIPSDRSLALLRPLPAKIAGSCRQLSLTGTAHPPDIRMQRCHRNVRSS